ncbi:MAG: hypothetical protein MZU97_13095 [Bacillus subtilis]|nr:hypothetical protein [Bacillus subtilis]
MFFCMPYVVLSISAEARGTRREPLRRRPRPLLQAGCRASPRSSSPRSCSGILTGMLIAFTMSIDDFLISFFNAGPGQQPLDLHLRRIQPPASHRKCMRTTPDPLDRHHPRPWSRCT